VLVVGAGFGGLSAAIQVAKSGENSFLVLERGSEVGGTWRDNTYPGATCDVPSQLYSFSFALNPDWSRSFSPQHEIQDYLRKVADSSGVLERFRFGVSLSGARWDDAAKLWQVETTAGSLTATVLVAAAGALSEPRMPDIEGIDSFAGPMFHTAQWNHDYELAGKRVAVIGTGASAIQVVPEIAKVCSRVDVYQRTAPWVMARQDRTFTSFERFAFRHVPGVQRLYRHAAYWLRESNVPMFTFAPRIGNVAKRLAMANIGKAIKDPELRRRVTPTFALGCKRVLISNDWYPALARDNVSLVTDGISKVTAHSVVTADGVEREVDAIIIATGFMPTDLPIAHQITGRDNRTLAQHWEHGGVRAYKGATVAGFPNLFFIVGPNTGLGHSSMVFVIEAQTAYLVDAMKAMRRHRLAELDVEPGAQAAYNARLQRRMKHTVWSRGGCQSWYLDSHGRNVTLWPRSTVNFRAITARFDLDKYRTVAREDVPARSSLELSA
jgi:cyclohexanone monooxygenase